MQQQLQAQLGRAEAASWGAQQHRVKRYHTPLGTLELTRRVDGSRGGKYLGEQALGLPADGWFSAVQELGCALSVGSEFAHANRLLERWSGVRLSERTRANHVEAAGTDLIALAATEAVAAVCPIRIPRNCRGAQPCVHMGDLLIQIGVS